MSDFKKYNDVYDPCMLTVLPKGVNLFSDNVALEQWLRNTWKVESINKIERSGKTKLNCKIKINTSSVEFVFRNNRTLHFLSPPTNIEGAFYVCNQLRKDFPNLDGKLIFLSEGEVVHFPFSCGEDELCRRIGFDDEFLDHELMQEMGLE
ncbi:hypothetical protein [Pseudovibrio sp. POLY-S9]|uniref:hypothetical protein n=1 Tax=Pseudovibrio sp. POLY-S9 TaxID=1576596 RepID=UPI000B01A15F|nr:hypothetical protein [Pseudovibrio sp. POLY-S9]